MADETVFISYKDSTYEIVSKVAYLIGVPKHFIEIEPDKTRLGIYEQLDRDKNARIIRHLSILRTAIERNFKNINNKMRYEYKTLLTLDTYIPQESVNQLSADGIMFYKQSNTKLVQHLIEINRLISDRINNCKSLFPMWLNWSYIRDLFIMPDGLTEEGTKAESNVYYANLSCYPYQMYINWPPRDEGNILSSDKKFVTLLYEWHEDAFTEYSRVSDVSGYVKGNIYDFIASSEKVDIVVDCENSDPYKLCASLRDLEHEYISKISRIILVDDEHTSTMWRILERFTDIQVEHIMTERIKQNKSLVDMKLAVRTCQEHYQKEVDAFILMSSDSDYWALISSLPEAKFLVMVEREKCGPDMKRAMADADIFYCFLDDFYSGNTDDIRRGAVLHECRRYVDEHMDINVNEMLDKALTETRADMTPAERTQFYDRYIKSMRLAIGADGDVKIEFNLK